MERSVDRRLSGLERAVMPELMPGIVVIFDPVTGRPLHPVRPAEVAFWIPENWRDHAKSNSGSGNDAGTPGGQ